MDPQPPDNNPEPPPTFVVPPVYVPFVPTEWSFAEFLEFLRVNNPAGYQAYIEENHITVTPSVPEPAAATLALALVVLAVRLRRKFL